MADLAVFILTFNEERHIARAIASVLPIARVIYVIDSNSTDRTVEIAEQLGATVYRNPFVNQSQQTQWALQKIGTGWDWLMRLDADEYIEDDLAAQIQRCLPGLPEDVAGVNLKRKLIFMDRWIRHGGVYPLIQLRLWRPGCAIMEDRWMDERMILTSGRAVTLEGGFADHNLNDLTFFTDKHNRYATREAIEILRSKPNKGAIDGHKGSFQASARRFIKERVYNRIPFPIGPIAYFFYRYFLLLGILDGREGLVYHVLQAFWYRFLVGAKVIQLERAMKGTSEQSARLSLLTELTGYAVVQDGSSAKSEERATTMTPS